MRVHARLYTKSQVQQVEGFIHMIIDAHILLSFPTAVTYEIKTMLEMKIMTHKPMSQRALQAGTF